MRRARVWGEGPTCTKIDCPILKLSCPGFSFTSVLMATHLDPALAGSTACFPEASITCTIEN